MDAYEEMSRVAADAGRRGVVGGAATFTDVSGSGGYRHCGPLGTGVPVTRTEGLIRCTGVRWYIGESFIRHDQSSLMIE